MAVPNQHEKVARQKSLRPEGELNRSSAAEEEGSDACCLTVLCAVITLSLNEYADR
ncbi:hypothetical protein PANT111_110009 [Pantoea brenneri]|uniref:Transposase n=1 Tax=Pantoea brenneri TaxID=472694 RepID=A0AAX3J257_9GAMM|nr:hypothetical protein PANT111_110009 [Pantoea brenneri]